jgi:hypothetical protein
MLMRAWRRLIETGLTGTSIGCVAAGHHTVPAKSGRSSTST